MLGQLSTWDSNSSRRVGALGPSPGPSDQIPSLPVVALDPQSWAWVGGGRGLNFYPPQLWSFCV